MLFYFKSVFVRCKKTYLRADGLAPVLGEIVDRTYGYETVVIIPFLLLIKLRDIKSVTDAQAILDQLIHEVWLDGDISPIVGSLNELGRDVGISRTVSPDGRLIITDNDIEKLKALGEKIAERTCKLFEPPFDRWTCQYLSLIIGRPGPNDVIINLDKD